MSLCGSVRTETGYESDSPHLSLLNLRHRQQRVASFQKRATQRSALRCSAASLLIEFQPQHPHSGSRTPSLLYVDSDSHNSMYRPQQCQCTVVITHAIQTNMQTHTQVHILKAESSATEAEQGAISNKGAQTL